MKLSTILAHRQVLVVVFVFFFKNQKENILTRKMHYQTYTCWFPKELLACSNATQISHTVSIKGVNLTVEY
jgi:hypothetical protein